MSTPTSLRAALLNDLEELQRRQLYRRCRIVDSDESAAHAIVNGKRLVSFCSNDYLGLRNHPRMREAFVTAAKKYGVGSGSAHLIVGHSPEHHALQEELAAFLGRESALLFSTGYMANLGLVTALVQRGDEIFEDKLNHASLIDAARLSGAKTRRYAHNDITALEKRLANAGSGRPVILSDAVFSMDGDIADLPELARLADQYNATLMIDDAHGIGVLGKSGRGSVEHFSLAAQHIPIVMGTLGKALGCFGAFVAGDDVVIQTLVQKARSYIYTTASPPAVAAATRMALRLIDDEAWRRDHLDSLINRFRQGAQSLGLTLTESESAIQPLILGKPSAALAASDALYERGFLVSAIRPPTVPVDSARLRVTLSAAHNDEQIDELLDALMTVLPKVAA